MIRQKIKPPKLLEYFIGKLLPDEGWDSPKGDFEECYSEIAKENGLLKAIIWYLWQIVILLKAKILSSFIWSLTMFKNYVRVAIRNITNHKTYSLINISGMVISIAACFFILKFVGYEMSYDSFHEKSENLYRLTNDRHQNGELIQHGVITYPSVPKTMHADYPEIVNYVRLDNVFQAYLLNGVTGFDESGIFADSAFFDMFSFSLSVGDPKNILAKPYSLVLSETLAEKYFGKSWLKDGIIGKEITFENRFAMTVTGVFKDIPANSHMQFDFVGSYSTFGVAISSEIEDSWTNSNYYVYLELAQGTNSKELESKFPDFSKRYFDGAKVTKSIESFFLQPLKDVHLYSDYEYEAWTHGNGMAVFVLLIIAGLVLLIAWVNYFNLSTAKSLERAKEAGMRRVLGAQKEQIIIQFMVEAILFNVIGFITAYIVVALAQPYFSTMLNVQFSSSFLTTGYGLVFILIFLAGTVISGMYSALITASFNASSVLKGGFKKTGKGRLIRQSLVFVQFALSFILIAGTYTVYSQIGYMMDKDLGINIDRTLVVNGPRLTKFDADYYDNISTFKTELMSQSSITNVTASGRVPGRQTGRIFNIKRLTGDSEKRYTTSDISVDYNFFNTFDMTFLAGREFKSTDHNLNYDVVNAIIINDAASKLFGFEKSGSAVQQELNFYNRNWTIIGVVADHHQQAPTVPKEPIIFTPFYSTRNYFFVKLNSNNISRSISIIEDKYNELFRGNSFNYFFLDDFFNEQYQADQNFRTIFSLFAYLGVILACLGLFGLSFFTISQRTKEIGIRKVLGATTNSIVAMFLVDFSKISIIAILLASPVTYFLINRWLNSYAYHIDLTWKLLVIPGVIIFMIAMITVSYKTVKAALLNPVEPLKYD